MKKFGKGAVIKISTAFGPFSLLLVEYSSERDFLDIYLTTVFGVCKFENWSAMRVIFVLKMFKMESKFRKCKKKF